MSKHRKKGFNLGGMGGIVIIAVLAIGGIVAFKMYNKKLDKKQDAEYLATHGVPIDAPLAAKRATYYNPYSYNARSSLFASVSPYYAHKGYFSAPQHSIGSHNVMPAFSFDRDDE